MSYSGSAGGGIGGVSPASTPQVAAVPGTKILLCKSGVKDKKPDPNGADYGELFVNYHSGSPMLCFKDNAGEIVEIKPTRNIDGGGGETPPSTGNEIGDTLWDGTHFRVWDGSTWVAVGPNDLAYVQKVDGGTITNSAGSDVDIPVVNNIQAGLMLPADKNKLDTYPDDSSDLEVDLGYTAAADKGTVTNSNGTDAEIPLANGTNAGLMAPGDKNKIDGYPATPDDLAATLDLQAVTDNGNTTTNGATFGNGNITLNADGSGEFAGTVLFGKYNSGSTNTNGARITASGQLNLQREDGATIENRLQILNGLTPVVGMKNDGSAEFAGDLRTPNLVVDPVSAGQGLYVLEPGIGNTETSIRLSADGAVDIGNTGINDDADSVRFKVVSKAHNDFQSANGITEDGIAFQVTSGGTANLADQLIINAALGDFAKSSDRVILNADDASQFSNSVLIGGTLPSSPNISLNADGSATFAGEVTADTFKYSGSAPSPALAGKEIDLVATLHLMAAKLAELGGVDVASLFVANDPAPVTQPADPVDDEGASSAY
nr:hypothetical protein [uncultured Mediterranean phage uvMED]